MRVKGEAKEGVFGKVKAYFYSVEEQARKNLHAHFLLWLEVVPFNLDVLEEYDMKSKEYKKESGRLTRYVNSVQSNELVGSSIAVQTSLLCEKNRIVKRKPMLKSKQILRYIRHKNGCKKWKGAIFGCPKCDKEWTSEDLAIEHAYNSICGAHPKLKKCKLSFDTSSDDKDIRSEKKMLLKEFIYQTKLHDVKDVDLSLVVNSTINSHSSFHV